MEEVKERPTRKVGRLSRKCGSVNVSQPHRPPRSATGIVLTFLLYERDFLSTRHDDYDDERISTRMTVTHLNSSIRGRFIRSSVEVR
jgi:hypothetical protein